MPKVVSFAEHIRTQLDHIRARQDRIKSKAAELEAAVQLIHPDYAVVVNNDTAEHLVDADIRVVFQGCPFSVDLGLIKHDDIYISDYAMELLIDRPVMCEDSPYFNAVLKNLILDKLQTMTRAVKLSDMSYAQLIELRVKVLEVLAKTTTAIKEAFWLVYDKTSVSMIDQVKTASGQYECLGCDPISCIDKHIAFRRKDRKIEVRPYKPTLKRIPAVVIFTEVGPDKITQCTLERFDLMNK